MDIIIKIKELPFDLQKVIFFEYLCLFKKRNGKVMNQLDLNKLNKFENKYLEILKIKRLLIIWNIIS